MLLTDFGSFSLPFGFAECLTQPESTIENKIDHFSKIVDDLGYDAAFLDPNLFDDPTANPAAVDIYAFGVLMLEMICRDFTYEDISNTRDILEAVGFQIFFVLQECDNDEFL